MAFRPQKLLFGLSLGISQKIKDQVESEILRRYPEMQTVCRYRKEGIYQYLREQGSTLVIMEENLQGGSGYTSAELQQLTDLGNSRIIFLMERTHSGDDYVKALYCCGICDGLYLDDATPKGVLDLAFHARGHEAARNYYGIQVLRDAEKADGIVNEERLGAYLEFIEEGAERGDLGDKYRFVSTRLSAKENRILAASISREVAGSLAGNEAFEFYRGGGRARKGLFRKRKQGKESERAAMPQEPLAVEPIAAPQEPLAEEAEAGLRVAAGRTSESDEEEMLRAMDRFWAADGKAAACMEEGGGTELMAMLAGYLNKIDT